MHFVDKDLNPNIYIANGGLISNNKVLTTRHFLEPYEEDIENRHLTIYSSKWKTRDPLSYVNKVHIDRGGRSQLAVASVSSCI